MTVKELIKQLKKFPKDATVCSYDTTETVEQDVNDFRVISCEYDAENEANEVTLYIKPLHLCNERESI